MNIIGQDTSKLNYNTQIYLIKIIVIIIKQIIVLMVGYLIELKAIVQVMVV